MRLIDADALYEKIAEWEATALHMVVKTMNDEDKTEWRRWLAYLDERKAFKYYVADAPTIEAEPVKHGKWIAVDSYSAFGGDEVTWYAHGNPIAFYYCSECKEQTYADEEGNSILSKYCPNCGAKMEEGEA